ncbi:hypothetical protein AB1Y20_005150 [Prymnesium parvum]|uniref:Uncharacterized protein n=1 Tax=Prymnesium parvum TaxID=97485 RepID=A0AB34J5R2_PRYPA
MAPAVAVLLSGSFRTLLDCNSSLVAHVHLANPSLRFHTFAFLTVADDAERRAAERLVRHAFPCVRALRVELDADVGAAVARELPPVAALPKGRGTARGKALNIVKMFRGIWAAHRLLRGAAREPPRGECAAGGGGEGEGGAYRLVLRVRPDLCFCKPLDLSAPASAVLAQCDPHTWYLPWWSSKLEWAFDQLALGSAEAMALYASAYRSTLTQMVTNRRELYPEAVMWEHLHSVTDQAKLKMLHGFHATLARPRASGNPYHDDPFGKVRIDAAPSAVFVPRSPTNSCIAEARSLRTLGSRAQGKPHGRRVRALRLREKR